MIYLNMPSKSDHLQQIIDDLYNLFKKQKKGVEESVIIKTIYPNSIAHLKKESITRQTNRLIRRMVKEKKCKIERKQNGIFKIAIDAKGNLLLNKQIETFSDIQKCLYKKDHAIKVLAIQGYISKKGKKDYDVIVMDANTKNSETYFKGYRVINNNGNIQLHQDGKLKRFYLSNCDVVIPRKLNVLSIDHQLKKKLDDFKMLQTDSFDFAIKKNTDCQTVTIYFTDYFNKYLSRQKNVRLNIEAIPDAEKSDSFQYKTEIRFNNIKNLIALISPHLDEIRFGDSTNDCLIKKEIEQYFQNVNKIYN